QHRHLHAVEGPRAAIDCTDAAVLERPVTRPMRRSLVLAVRLALLAPVVPLVLSGQGRPSPTRVEVAPGIFVFMTSPYGDVGLDGNSVAILGTDGVLVFDTNGTPAAAAAV